MEDIGEVDFSYMRSGEASTHLRKENHQRGFNNIIKDIESFGFPLSIASAAAEKYISLKNGQISRETPRKRLMFYVVYQAYLESGIHRDPFMLGAKMGLTAASSMGAATAYSVLPGIRSVLVLSRPEDFVIEIAEHVGLNPRFQKALLDDVTTASAKFPELLEHPPTSARVLLYLFCEKHQLLLPFGATPAKQKENFCRFVCISTSKLESARKSVLKIFQDAKV